MANIFISANFDGDSVYQTVISDIRKSLESYAIEVSLSYPDTYIHTTIDKRSFYLSDSDVVITVIDHEAVGATEFVIAVLAQFNYCRKLDKLFIPVIIGEFDENFIDGSVLKDIFRHPPSISLVQYTREQILLIIQMIGSLIESYLNEFRIGAKAQEIKQNIEAEGPKFIANATSQLKNRAEQLRKTASSYFIGAYLIILAGIGLAIWFYSVDKTDLQQMTNKLAMIFFFIKGLVILTLVTATVKYSFTLGRAYMHEALKIEDRIHAITFGEFYLNVYKEGIRPEDLKEVFRDWNINNTSTAFLVQKTDDWDPKILDKLLDVASKIKESKN